MSENAHYLRGIAKIKENKFEEALELLTKAIEEEPKNPFFYNHRAVAYLNLNKFELSMFDMNMSVQLDDTYAYFYSCRGFLKAKLRDLEGAIEDYETSLELDPENEITYNNLGLVLEQMGSMNRAEQMYKKGNQILGYDPEKRVLDESGSLMVNKETESPATTEEKAALKKENRKKKGKAAKKVFSSRTAFMEFLRFIGNGFKLKTDHPKTTKDNNDKKGKG